MSWDVAILYPGTNHNCTELHARHLGRSMKLCGASSFMSRACKVCCFCELVQAQLHADREQSRCGSAAVTVTGGIVGGGWAGVGSLTLTELAKGRLQFRAPRNYGGYFRRDQEHRDFVSIGTAAGARPLECMFPLFQAPVFLLIWHRVRHHMHLRIPAAVASCVSICAPVRLLWRWIYCCHTPLECTKQTEVSASLLVSMSRAA